MMKEKLQHAFKPTPERFGHTVDSAVDEAMQQAQTAAPRRRLSKGMRAAVALALVAALLPSAVFGASKLYEMMAQPVDDYGLEIDVERERTAVYPKYVKMNVDIPEGFAAVPNTGKLKYYNLSTEEPYTDGYSLFPMRFRSDSEQKEYIGNVNSYEERMMNGHQAYELKLNGGGWNRLYVYYEDVNVFLLIYHKDVTDEQLEDFVKGITFTEGDANDFTYLDTPHDERPQEDAPRYEYNEVFTEYPRDTKVTFKEYSPLTDEQSIRVTAQVTDVRITDNIAELDYDAFSPFGECGPYEIADQYGNLLPQTFMVFKEGNGFESADEIISTELANEKLILADVTYENLSDEDVDIYIPYTLEVMEKEDDGTYRHAHVIDRENGVFSTAYTDGEMVYLNPHGVGADFYFFTLPANGSVSFTMGWRCKADMVDKAYLSLNYPGNVIDPPKPDDNPYASYLFKVQ